MPRLSFRLTLSLLLILIAALNMSPAIAAVHDLAAEFDGNLTSNPDGVWTYGYLTSNSGAIINDSFIQSATNGGFVAYDQTGSAGGTGTGWTTGFGFPFSGVLNVPQTTGSVAPFPSLTDFPSAEGDNPNYPNGMIGGHSPNCTLCSGWYAVKYTAPSSGPVDIELDSWQTAIYPSTPTVGGADPLYGGNTRPHQILIEKVAGATSNLLRTPMVSRHGWVNRTGMPEYTAESAPTPGDPASFATQQDEIDAAIKSSASPNKQVLTGVQLNAGESIIISFAPYFNNGSPTGGVVQSGWLGFNATVRDGADRVNNSRWDLAGDWSVQGSSASGLGPDGAWSYGILQNGSFAPYDKILFGQVSDDGAGTRENHGWGSNAPGWFVASAAEPETGPVVPGMVKDYDGFNLTKTVSGGIVSSVDGDWSGGQVALHTPTAEVDAAQTSVIRWTAPRNMSVDINGGMWRLTLPDASDRRHEYTLLHNGTSIASGIIAELGFDCGAGDTNSACAESIAVNNFAVQTGDTLDLQISPISGGGSLAADFDMNNTVNDDDLALWAAAFGQGDGGDADGDLDTDGVDFLIWQREFGMTGGGGSNGVAGFVGVEFTVVEAGSAATVVPEPSSWALLLVLPLAGTCSRIRARRSPMIPSLLY